MSLICISDTPRDHPRLRGEYDVRSNGNRTVWGSPPLARGVRCFRHIRIRRTGITPACAGSTLLIFCTFFLFRDHPRLRGEYSQSEMWAAAQRGSPPLARGVLSALFHSVQGQGITPACAGSTTTISFFPAAAWDHPRLRGEYTKNSL